MLLTLGCASKPAPAPAPAPPPPPADGGAELVIEGALETRVSTWEADLVLFYGGETKGSVETCGCPKRPRGSLSRLQAYLVASRAQNTGVPDLLLHGGYLFEDAMGLDGGLRADVPVLNTWMRTGIEALGVDAVNVAYVDLPGFQALEAAPDWGVSANVRGPDGRAPAAGRLLDADGVKVGVTGITTSGMTFVETPEYTVDEPVEAAVAALQDLSSQGAEVLVLLAYDAPAAAKEVAARVPELDVVIDTAMHREFYEPFVEGHAVWVRSHYQTMRLGELRLKLDDGRVVGHLDRKIDLDPEVPDDLEILEILVASRAAIGAAQEAVFGP